MLATYGRHASAHVAHPRQMLLPVVAHYHALWQQRHAARAGGEEAGLWSAGSARVSP